MVIGYPRWLDAQDKQSIHGKRTPERRQAGDSIPQPSAFTIGGMALVQCLKGDQKTFAAVAETVLRKVLNEGGASDRIDVIFDVLPAHGRKTSTWRNCQERHWLSCVVTHVTNYYLE